MSKGLDWEINIWAIFLSFGTSLALLEAELAPFKDWEDIGDI